MEPSDFPPASSLNDGLLATYGAEALKELIGRGRLVLVVGHVRVTADTAPISVISTSDTVTITAFPADGALSLQQQGQKG